MIGQIRRFHFPDINDLEKWVPGDPDCFGFLLQVMIGPPGGEGEDSFEIQVCTPACLIQHYERDGMVIGRHHLIVFGYNWDRIKAFIAKFVTRSPGDNWREVATKLGRLGRWEFEDYDDRPVVQL